MDDVNVEKDSTLEHLEGGAETRPDFDLVVGDLGGLARIEEVPSDLLESDLFEHGVEEDLQKHQHVVVGLCNALHPRDVNFVLNIVD